MYFTFHYVSILIPKGHEVHSLCFHFTFHGPMSRFSTS